MNLKIERETLLEKAQAVSKIILKKNAIAIYDHILFHIWTEGVTLTASNGNTQIQTTTQCKSGHTFKFCVPAEVFISTIRYMREQEVKIAYTETVDGKNTSRVLMVTCGKSKYKIACEDPDIFPIIQTTRTEKEMLLDAGEFKQAFSTAESFVPAQSDLPSFTGVHIKHTGEGNILIEGGDRTSIGRASFRARSLTGFDEVIVLKDSIPVEVLDKSEKLNVLQHDNSLQVISDQFTIITLLMKEKYPDTDKVFKTQPDTGMSLNCVQVIDCISRLKGYVGESGGVSVAFGKDIVMQAVDAGRNNHGEEVIEAECPLDVTTGFNPVELLHIFSKAGSDQVMTHYSGQKNPFFFTPEGNDSTVKYKFLLAPMTL